MGGHDVPVVDIRRRFHRGLIHLVEDYIDFANRWIIWDNTRPPAKVLASSDTHTILQLREML
jgi:predicted ABC-type ATPase